METESVTTVATGPHEGSQEPFQAHWECGLCIVLAVVAGYLWGRRESYRPFRATTWNGQTEPIRHGGRVTVTDGQFQTMLAKSQRYDKAALMWPQVQEAMKRS